MIRLLLLAAAAATLTGCLDRHLAITSDPPGARVYVNDVELGTTPVEAAFTYYGKYDVLVTKDGYEPLRLKVRAVAPVYEYPPFDLAASVLPLRIENEVDWHFTLSPALETTQTPEELNAGLLERSRRLRGEVK